MNKSIIRPIHPFPARMASEIAIEGLKDLDKGAVVLDPMVGSGTVVRHASNLELNSIGFDLDPLAVLIARAWTTAVSDDAVAALGCEVVEQAKELKLKNIHLPWIDDDEETRLFVNFWFGAKQRTALRKIAATLDRLGTVYLRGEKRAALTLLRVSFSRIIITKDSGASLGRDVSHSRPHKVSETSDFDVFKAFERSIQQVRRLMALSPPLGKTQIMLGDARSMKLDNRSVDAVLTSPPYLNAIDYMRGHRLALVWLGHSLRELRAIRSSSIGSERGPDHASTALFEEINAAMVDKDCLSPRHGSVVLRYAEDLYRLMSEIARVLKPGASATLVVGNSCLKGTFISNSSGVTKAGTMVGLRLVNELVRELPERNRYLPLAQGALNKRMRTESVLSLVRS